MCFIARDFLRGYVIDISLRNSDQPWVSPSSSGEPRDLLLESAVASIDKVRLPGMDLSLHNAGDPLTRVGPFMHSP